MNNISYPEYLLSLLHQELVLAQSRQKQNAPRKSGYITGLEKAIQIIKQNM